MRIVALVSGSGTTLQNLLDRGFAISGVVASRPGIGAIARAESAGVPVAIVRDPAQVFEALTTWKPDLVCLCGWLKLLRIPPDYQHRVLNIHPALLPAFGGAGMYGRHVHEAVLKAGVKISGCTVHFADNTYDTGPILVQRAVPVHDDDTPETLAARVFAAECEAYPDAITWVSSGRWRLDGRRVIRI